MIGPLSLTVQFLSLLSLSQNLLERGGVKLGKPQTEEPDNHGHPIKFLAENADARESQCRVLSL